MTLVSLKDYQLFTKHEPMSIGCPYRVKTVCGDKDEYPISERSEHFEYKMYADINIERNVEISGYTNYFSETIRANRRLQDLCRDYFGYHYDPETDYIRYIFDSMDNVIYLKTRADAIQLKLLWGTK